MLQQYKILTVTHRHTNLKDIGRFVIKADGSEQLRAHLTRLRAKLNLDELFYTATCNRVLYLFVTSQELDDAFVSRFFTEVGQDLQPEMLQQVRRLSGEAAVGHLYDVAASIDSLVIGERQILGQLRESFDQCRDWELTGDALRLLFQHAVLAARDVYANTRIGEKPVSVVSLAVQKLLRLGVPTQARVLLIGAGQTNALAAKFLKKNQFEHVTVFNRTLERAEQVAATFDHGRARALADLATYSEGFDVIIVCTGAKDPVITENVLQQLLQGEAAAGKVVIDLAIPHNVAREAMEAFACTYIEIEDLRQLAQENLAFREQEIQRARHLLEVHLEEFPILFRQRQLELALRRLPEDIKAVRARAMNEVFRKEVEGLDDNTRELLDRMMAYMEKKCIGIPMKAAREALLG